MYTSEEMQKKSEKTLNNKRNKQKTASEIFAISQAAFRYMWKK